MSPSPLEFTVVSEDESSAARLGRLQLPHGVVDTPAFLPVGIQGAVKAVTPEQVADAIVKGVERQKREIVIPFMYRLTLLQYALLPRLVDWLVVRTGWKRSPE